MTDLPQGWVETTLGTLSEYITSGSRDWSCYYADQGSLFIRTQDIKTNSLDEFSNIARVSLPDRVEGKRTLVLPNDILITITGANVGKVAIVPDNIPEAYVSQSVALVRLYQPDQARFLQKAIMDPQDDGVSALRGAAYGQGRPVLSLSDVRDTPIPLPPLPEQRRIVRKLDTLSAHSNAARSHLTAIEKLVERYRKAVFLAAYNGDLSSPDLPRQSSIEEGLWDIPQGWQWKTIEDVAEIQLALTPVSEIKDLPHIAPDNVEKSTGQLLPYRTISEDKVISAKHRFYPGQIVYSKIRPYLRKAVLPNFEGACSADMYPVAPRKNCDIRFLFFWLLSEEYAYFASRSEGRTVLPKINKKQMYASPIPLPPLDEQREIVRLIETAFAKIDRLAAEARKALKLLGHLDQRTLSKAFAGELVAQDPTEEPASVLLERIRAARARGGAPKRGRKPRAE